jgi:hypothetical protein
MAEKTETSQSQQRAANSNGAVAAGFGKLADEQVGRMGAFFDEARKLEGKWLEYGTSTIDEASALMKGSFGYLTQLSADWRRISLESARRTAELFTRS